MNSWRILSAVSVATLVFSQGCMVSAQSSDATVNASQVPAAPPSAAPNPVLSSSLSTASREVAKLAAGGISPDVIKAYIDNSASAFNLTADGIIKLQSAGVANSLITAMMAHDKEMRDRGQVAVLPQPQIPPQPQYPAPDPNGGTPQPMSPPPYGYDPQNQPPPDYSDLSPYGSWYYDQPEAEWYWQPYPSLWNYGYPWGFGVLNNGRWWYHNNHGWVWSRGGANRAGRTYYSAPQYRGGGTQVFARQGQNFGGVQSTVIHQGFSRGGGTVSARVSGGGYGSAGGHH